jgi:hypothetical protein
MKDNRFIELVNLYIDRQISGEEIESLEAEMQANPRRRAIYRQYCQMHRATTLVYESFRSENTEQSADNLRTQAKVARFEPQSGRRKHWTYYATGLAAACVALVCAKVAFTGNRVSSQQNSIATVQAKPAAVAVVAQSTPAVTAPAVIAVDQFAAKPVSAHASNLVASQDYAAMLAAMRKEDQRAFASGQIQPSRTTSLFEDGVFDSQPMGSSRIFRNKPTTSQQAEFAAFQFQR